MNIEMPSGFQLRVVNGYSLGGIVLQQRRAVCSSLVPARLVTAQTAFHFMNALQIRQQRLKRGVLVLRYDTSSRLNTWIPRRGRRNYHHADFQVIDSPESIRVRCDSDDGVVHITLTASPQRILSPRSIFRSKDQLRQILQEDLRSFRLTRPACRRHRLTTPTICRCQMIPLQVKEVESSVFGDPEQFHGGTAEFDSAYWLREDEMVWNDQWAACCNVATA